MALDLVAELNTVVQGADADSPPDMDPARYAAPPAPPSAPVSREKPRGPTALALTRDVRPPEAARKARQTLDTAAPVKKKAEQAAKAAPRQSNIPEKPLRPEQAIPLTEEEIRKLEEF